MSNWMTLSLDGNQITFTEDGRVVLEDALQAAGGLADTKGLIHELCQSHPEIMGRCQRVGAGDAAPRLVADGETWGAISALMLTRLLETGALA